MAGSLEIDSAILAESISTITSKIGNERVRIGRKRSGFTDDVRPGRIFLREYIERIGIEAKVHVLGGDLENALGIASQMSKQRGVLGPQLECFPAQQGTGRILLEPVLQILSCLGSPLETSQERQLHRPRTRQMRACAERLLD